MQAMIGGDQMGFPFDIAMRDSRAHTKLLDGDARAREVLKLVGGYLRDGIALLRSRDSPPFRGQPRQGFAHRARAEAEAAGSVADDDLGARRQTAFEDFSQQRF